MSVYRVGITGGIACGKSTVAARLAACGVYVADADAIVGELTAAGGSGLCALREQVGEWVVTDSGEYNRPAVRREIFSNPQLRRCIESILHPLVREVLSERLAAAAGPYAVGVIPLLFEGGSVWTEYFQHIVVIDCSPAVQRARVAARDGQQDGEHIIAAQMPAEKRRRLADTVIDNNGSEAELAAAVEKLHGRLLAASVS